MTATVTEHQPAWLTPIVVALALAVAVLLRLAPVFADFPFGDGGMFWVMARELGNNEFLPPMTTSYNSAGIPWVYPPIGLYLLAALGGGIEWLRYLPALFAIATLPAMWLLARSLLTERGALVALVAYGLSLPAYFGLFAGGGVTRAPGLLFVLLAMWAVVRERVVTAGVLAGLTLLTHPIAALYGLLSCLALWVTRGTPPKMLWALPIAAATASLWFVPMIAIHGIEPFLGGAASRDLDPIHNLVVLAASVLNPPNLAFTIGIVGIGVAIKRRRWDLIAWVAVTFFGVAVLDRWLVIPFAVLAGLAVDAVLERPARMASVALLSVAGVTMVTGVVLTGPTDTMSPEERELMDWARTETPSDSTFALIGYSTDRGMVEWFPAVSGRRNLTTWQGTEWLPGKLRISEAKAAAACMTVDCLPEADYYVLRPECCSELEAGLVEVRSRVYIRAP